MTSKDYDKLFAAGMALVTLLLAILMLCALGCTVESKQSLTIKKAKTCAAEKSATSRYPAVVYVFN